MAGGRVVAVAPPANQSGQEESEAFGLMAVIGITSCRKLEDYRQAVLHVGGEVRILDHAADRADDLTGLDGLLLTGGTDVDPDRYQEEPHAAVADVDPARDAFEIGLIASARAQGLPILAICRGIQVLNVARGGSLVQDIPTQLTGALDHNRASPPNEPYALAHEVWIEKDSLLAVLMKERLNEDTCEVNSRHHQSVARLGEGLKVSATAPDGVIEAIEDPSARFCLGVQWHPENFWRTGEFRPLFEGFVNAAQTSHAG
jgi:putative glutamine amidotransferase